MRLLISIFILFNFSFAKTEYEVLIINSYHSGYEWSDTVMNNMQKVFKSNINISVNVLYMDSKRITSKDYFESLENLYDIQLKDRKYDLVVAVDRFAYDFILENYDKFFTDEKVLAVGLERFSIENAQNHGLGNKVSALLERRAIEENIYLINKMYPKLKKLYILNDSSENGDHTQPFILKALRKIYNTYDIEYIRDTTKEELEKRFDKKNEDEALLFIRFYKDKNNKFLQNNKISDTLKNIKLPIFITDSLFINSNILAGKIVELDRFGETAGNIALKILKDKNLNIVRIDKNFEYIFDYSSLKEHETAVPAFLEDYKIINTPLSYFEKNRTFIDNVFLFTPVLILLIMGLIHNIYFRRKSERSLRNRVKFDEVLLNSIENPIFWQNPDGKIIDANEFFCELIGVPYKKLYRKKLEELNAIGNVSFIIEILEKYSENKLDNNNFIFFDKFKKEYDYLIKQRSYKVDKNLPANKVTIFIDITKERKNEKEKARNQQFIIQQSKLAEIGEVFSSIAHQWKSPLVNITAIAQNFFYDHNDKKNSEEDCEYLDEIMRQVQYMTDTMNEFQNFILPSKKKSDFDVHESIESILDIVHHNIKYNYIDVNIEVEKDANLIVNGYKNEFMQCFLNIINNAKDALILNEVTKKRINVKLYNKKDKVYIDIKDNAGGIEEKKLEKIFLPYYTTKKDGHGIGLHMCKVIIEDKMNGKLSVKNYENGACFTICL